MAQSFQRILSLISLIVSVRWWRGAVSLCALCMLLLTLRVDASFALEWKHLHDIALKTTSSQAQAAVDMSPTSVDFLYILGLCYLKEYRHLEARDIFERILFIDSSVFEARWGVAEVWTRDYFYEKSEPVLLEIIKAHPDFAPAYLTLSSMKYIQMDFKKSAQYAADVFERGEENVDAYLFIRSHVLYAAAKGMVAHYGGPWAQIINFASVRKHLKIAQKLDPDSPVVSFGWGSFYMLIPRIVGRDFVKAKEYLQKTIEEEPGFPLAYIRLAQIYKHEGDLAMFDQLMQKALALDPQNPVALDILNGTCRFICLD